MAKGIVRHRPHGLSPETASRLTVDYVRGVVGRSVVLLSLLVPVLAACGGGSSQAGTIGNGGGTVRSSDGIATLTVPAGALNQDAAIRLTAGSLAGWPDDFSGSQPIAAYQLQPSGLHFAQPAQLDVQLPLSGTNGLVQGHKLYVPEVMIQDGVNLTAVQSKVSIDLSKQQAILQVPIPHFSEVKIAGFWLADFSPETVTRMVGDSWTVDVGLFADLTPKTKPFTGAEGKTTGTTTTSRSIDLTNIAFKTVNPPVGVVGSASHADIHLAGSGQEFTTIENPSPTFDCLAPGGGAYLVSLLSVLHIHSSTTYTVNGNQVTSPGVSRDVTTNVSLLGGASCTPKPTTTTSSSTTSTTVTPTTATGYPNAITAYFDQGAFSTYYTEPIYNPSWSYSWSVSIPVDPKCADGFHGSTPTPDKATWYHANTTQGGPCNHSGNAYSDATGHPGTVSLVVTPSDHSWHCEMLFNGSAPNNQDPRNPAVGNNPQCQRP